MADADSLLRVGDLAGARAALVEIVRAQPANQQARMFLFQLFAVMGEWAKARSQLEALAKLSPEAQMLAVTYNQAIAAEELRASIFAGTAAMPLLLGEGTWADGVARSISLAAQGDFASAEDARNEAFDAAPDMPGTLDGVSFDWIGDADMRFGPTFEAVIGGRYGLVPFDQVDHIKSDGPQDLRDTVWYPVQIAFKAGQSAAALLPTRYPGSEFSDDSMLALGRSTVWVDRDWGQEAGGLHLWGLSGGEERGLTEVRSLNFD